jgi:hypothetical protein
MKRVLSILALVTLVAVPVLAGSPTEEAKKVYEQYVALDKKHDPAMLQLYADNAVINRARRKPDGTTQTTKIPVKAYKEAVAEAMPFAKEIGESNEYSNASFKEVDGKVHVTATRRAQPKGPPTELTLVIAQKGERWLIVEETALR